MFILDFPSFRFLVCVFLTRWCGLTFELVDDGRFFLLGLLLGSGSLAVVDDTVDHAVVIFQGHFSRPKVVFREDRWLYHTGLHIPLIAYRKTGADGNDVGALLDGVPIFGCDTKHTDVHSQIFTVKCHGFRVIAVQHIHGYIPFHQLQGKVRGNRQHIRCRIAKGLQLHLTDIGIGLRHIDGLFPKFLGHIGGCEGFNQFRGSDTDLIGIHAVFFADIDAGGRYAPCALPTAIAKASTFVFSTKSFASFGSVKNCDGSAK